VRRAFEAWKQEIVTADGAGGFLRARRPDTPDGVANSTVSEGIAYGMMIAVQMNEQSLFDGFWQYALLWLNERGLMDWYIAPDGSRRLATGAASDADEDMAWALVMADRQWDGRGTLGESYASHAARLIDNIYKYEVDHAALPDLFLPGDDWRGQDVFNPSYFAPNQYKLFAELDTLPDAWLRVVNVGYETLSRSLNEHNANADNGLVPAWCTSTGAPVETFPGALTNYQYDSARTPFRLAQDWAFRRDERAKTYLAKVSAFFAGVGAEHIVDGYSLAGTPAPDPRSQLPNPGSAVFVGCAAVGAMHDARHQAFIDQAYARVRSGQLLARSRYYNLSWTVLSLLMLTGNFVEFPR
jgi:endo-1,4-beta-D-glucanase Y